MSSDEQEPNLFVKPTLYPQVAAGTLRYRLVPEGVEINGSEIIDA